MDTATILAAASFLAAFGMLVIAYVNQQATAQARVIAELQLVNGHLQAKITILEGRVDALEQERVHLMQRLIQHELQRSTNPERPT